MQVSLDLQLACDDETGYSPNEQKIIGYVKKALEMAGYTKDSELTVRMVNEAEIHELNKTYRGMDKPTNILSFPFECPKEVQLPLLGDLIVCTKVLVKEAKEQDKTVEEHMAHLIVHGTLHLLGYDHIEDDEALEMESLETKIMLELGFKDPYLSEK